MLKAALASFAALLAAATVEAAAAPAPAAPSIVLAWRQAVHAGLVPGLAAHARYSTSENGEHGTIEEWVTPVGLYRRAAKREFEECSASLAALGYEVDRLRLEVAV